MNLAPNLEPPDDDRHLAVEAYTRSDQFITDALDWVGTYGHEHADVVEAVTHRYEFSKQFDTVIDDAMAGEVVTW